MGRRFGGMPGNMNMNQMMKQVQKMQDEMEKNQKELEEKIVEASSGGGAVTARMNGKRELVELKIEEDIVDPEDMEMLEDLIIAAVNSALTDIEKIQDDAVSKLTGGLNIPGL